MMNRTFLFLTFSVLSFSSYSLENKLIYDRLLQAYSCDQESFENNEQQAKAVDSGMDNPWCQRELLFKLFGELLVPRQKVLALQTIDDLQLYCGAITHPSFSLFSHIDRTVTSFGQAYLAFKLANPVTDIGQLKKRQMHVRKLHRGVLPFDDIEKALQDILGVEPAIYGYWNKLDASVKKTIDSAYFSIFPDSWNTSEKKLEFAIRGGQLFYLSLMFSQAIVTGTIGLCEKSFGYSKRSYSAIFKEAMKAQWSSLFEVFKWANIKQGIWAWTHIHKPSGYHKFHLLDTPGKERIQLMGFANLDVYSNSKAAKAVSLLEYPFALTVNGFNLFFEYRNLCSILKSNSTVFSLHKKVMGFAVLCQQTKKLRELIGNEIPFPELSSELNELYQLLNSKTFINPSHFAYMGRVLKVNRLIQDHKDEFTTIFAWVGKVDAYMSMAKILKEHTHISRFTYASYALDNNSYLAAHGFWNPFIAVGDVVKNSIELGTIPQGTNVILTGSNAGGKSTTMKALLFNVILSQTFGIAAADDFVIKPFSTIYSSMQLIDDLASGKSHFAAEIDRAKEIYSAAENASGPTFFAIDELFTGTSSNKGAELSSRLLKRLFSKNQCMTICATHYNQLTDLSESSNCINMRMGAPVKDDSGRLCYPYVLKHGISTVNVAEDMFEGVFSY